MTRVDLGLISTDLKKDEILNAGDESGVSFSDRSGKAAHTLKIFLALVVSPAWILTFHAKSRDFSSRLSALIGLLEILTLHLWIECIM